MPSPLIQLICLGLSQRPNVPDPQRRISLLLAAAPHLDSPLREHVETAAATLQLAESAQLELQGLLHS